MFHSPKNPIGIPVLIPGLLCLIFFNWYTVIPDSKDTPSMFPSKKSQKTVLFDGQSLNGWYMISNDTSVTEVTSIFTVNDGAIHVYGNQKNRSTQPFAGLFTNETYDNYKLHLEFRWGNMKFRPRHNFVRDAGVIIHQHGPDVIWPNGIECQIQEGDTGDLWIIGAKASSKVHSVVRNYNPDGELVTYGDPGQRYHRTPRSYSWEQSGWNTIELVVRGDDAEFWINGHLVNEAIDMKYWDSDKEEWLPLTRGKIMIQAEGAELLYRNIYLEGL